MKPNSPEGSIYLNKTIEFLPLGYMPFRKLLYTKYIQLTTGGLFNPKAVSTQTVGGEHFLPQKRCVEPCPLLAAYLSTASAPMSFSSQLGSRTAGTEAGAMWRSK